MRTWRWLAPLLLAGSIALAPSLAEARAGASVKSGGSTSYLSQGSRGYNTYEPNGAGTIQRSTTPQPGFNSPAYAPAYGGSFAQRHPFLTGIAGGFFGSWIGSLLFPHWGGYYGGGFGGMIGSLFSWLLIIGLGFWLFRIFRSRFAPAGGPDVEPMAYRAPLGSSPLGIGYGGGAPRGENVAISGADYQSFEAILKTVQGAWSNGDLQSLRNYVTPEMLGYFNELLDGNASQGVTNRVEQVELLRGDLREAWDEGNLQYATAYLRWRAIDYTARNDRRPGDPDYLVNGDPQHPSEAAEVWTFVRSPGGQWLLSAIQQV